MGVIDANNLKWYKSTNWTYAATHGGNIDTTATITSNVANNIFSDVSDTWRSSGTTDARKVFFRNENADSYTPPKYWISANTPAVNDNVYLTLAGTMSQWGTAISIGVTATFATTTAWIVTDTSPVGKVATGERVFNSTDDAYTLSATISSVTATGIQLTGNYAGTAGNTKAISVASANTFASYAPTAFASAFTGVSLAQNESQGIWIHRVILPGGSGYVNNSFTITASNS